MTGKRKFSALEREENLNMAAVGCCCLMLSSVVGSRRSTVSNAQLGTAAIAAATVIANEQTAPRLQYSRHDLGIDDFSDAELQAYFRFRREDLKEMASLLKVPSRFLFGRERDRHGQIYYARSCPGQHALLVVLARLALTWRNCDLSQILCMDEGTISKCYNEFMHWILRKWGDKLESLTRYRQRMPRYAEAFRQVGVPEPVKLWAAIDGTLRPMRVPQGRNNLQRENFNGHKRKHGLVYQAITTPDGLIAHISKPVPGRRHDMYALRQSGVYSELQSMWGSVAYNNRYHILGDPAYMNGMGILTNFRASTGQMTSNQLQLYHTLNKCRTFVEWSFGELLKIFPFLNIIDKMKLALSPIGRWYRVGAFFHNLHLCCYGGVSNSYFNCPPPTMSQYLGYSELM